VAAHPDSYSAYNAHDPDGPGPVGYLALVLAWAVPGLGHILLGQRTRGIIFAVTIHLLFAGGLLVAGIRAINPQDQAIWTYTQFLSGWPMVVSNYVEQQARPLWFDADIERPSKLRTLYREQTPIPETLEQRQTRAIAFFADHPLFVNHPKVQDMGAVYCGIAGMLNLLVMFDVLLRITGSVREDFNKKKRQQGTAQAHPEAPSSAPAGGAA
jgi:hypothetical protein